jgi:hypothetical protein
LFPALAFVQLLTTGCTSSRFLVVDANTRQPINDVRVAGYRSMSYQRVPDDYTWVEVDSSMTNGQGDASASHPLSIVKSDNEYRFVFTKPGYKSAEALIFQKFSLIASPADNAGWHMADTSNRDLRGLVPSKNFEQFNRGEMLIVPLYPEDPPVAATVHETD